MAQIPYYFEILKDGLESTTAVPAVVWTRSGLTAEALPNPTLVSLGDGSWAAVYDPEANGDALCRIDLDSTGVAGLSAREKYTRLPLTLEASRMRDGGGAPGVKAPGAIAEGATTFVMPTGRTDIRVGTILYAPEANAAVMVKSYDADNGQTTSFDGWNAAVPPGAAILRIWGPKGRPMPLVGADGRALPSTVEDHRINPTPIVEAMDEESDRLSTLVTMVGEAGTLAGEARDAAAALAEIVTEERFAALAQKGDIPEAQIQAAADKATEAVSKIVELGLRVTEARLSKLDRDLVAAGGEVVLSSAARSALIQQLLTAEGGVEGEVSVQGLLRLLLSTLTGPASGATGKAGTMVFKSRDGTKNRLTLTVDAHGNRAAAGALDLS